MCITTRWSNQLWILVWDRAKTERAERDGPALVCEADCEPAEVSNASPWVMHSERRKPERTVRWLWAWPGGCRAWLVTLMCEGAYWSRVGRRRVGEEADAEPPNAGGGGRGRGSGGDEVRPSNFLGASRWVTGGFAIAAWSTVAWREQMENLAVEASGGKAEEQAYGGRQWRNMK
jgi:hypothetical protein